MVHLKLLVKTVKVPLCHLESLLTAIPVQQNFEHTGFLPKVLDKRNDHKHFTAAHKLPAPLGQNLVPW